MNNCFYGFIIYMPKKEEDHIKPTIAVWCADPENTHSGPHWYEGPIKASDGVITPFVRMEWD